MTLHDDLTRTAALLRAGWPITNLSRAKRAQEQADMPRIDPIAEPRDVRPRPRRQCIPALHVEAAPDPIDDDAREFVAQEVDIPPVARAVGVEAYRRRVDSLAADLYPARQLEAAREREAHLAALIDDALRDGATTGAAIAARLTAMGVGVRR